MCLGLLSVPSRQTRPEVPRGVGLKISVERLTVRCGAIIPLSRMSSLPFRGPVAVERTVGAGVVVAVVVRALIDKHCAIRVVRFDIGKVEEDLLVGPDIRADLLVAGV